VLIRPKFEHSTHRHNHFAPCTVQTISCAAAFDRTRKGWDVQIATFYVCVTQCRGPASRAARSESGRSSCKQPPLGRCFPLRVRAPQNAVPFPANAVKFVLPDLVHVFSFGSPSNT
jgi:hypothetical protein